MQRNRIYAKPTSCFSYYFIVAFSQRPYVFCFTTYVLFENPYVSCLILCVCACGSPRDLNGNPGGYMAPRRTQWHPELYVPMRALDPPRRPQWKPRRGPTMMDKRGGTRRVLFARTVVACLTVQCEQRLASRFFDSTSWRTAGAIFRMFARGLSARDLPTWFYHVELKRGKKKRIDHWFS